jgi:ferredoxin
MNLASVAERVASLERETVTLDQQRCLHSIDRFSACQACLGLCPAGAIQPGQPPALTPEACQTCLACLPVCPTGAFRADDAVPALLECAARVETDTLELVCQYHPEAERGLSAAGAAIRVRGCLAGLGVGALLALAALEGQQVVARADACGQCAWTSLSKRLAANVAQARQLLQPWGRDQRLSLMEAAAADLVPRRVVEADNPPLSRRDLFRLAARRGQVVMARAVTQTGTTTGPRPARERQRVLNALAALPARACPASADHRAGSGYAMVQVSAACSACGACTRACMTGALQWERPEPTTYRLVFQPRLCNGCEACRHVCVEAAITVAAQPAFEAVFAEPALLVLSAGGLMRCQRCQAWTALRPGQHLCPTCEFRRTNPFGARPTPGRPRVRS